MSKKLSFDVNVDCIIVSAFLLVFTHWIFSHIWKVTLIIIPTSTIQHLNKVFLISIIVRVWGIPVCVIHFFYTFTPNKIHLLCFIPSGGPSCITPVTIASVCTIRMKYSDNYHCQLSVTSNSTYHSRAINAYFTGLISKIVLFYRSDYYFYTIILQQ